VKHLIFRVCLVVILAGCRRQHVAAAHEEAGRLRASVEKHGAEYRLSVEAENLLTAETIAWLKGDAVTAPRSLALAKARQVMDRWARVYFVPRYMHEQLRFDEYSSARVQAIQRQMLDHLKQRYFELHEYQRYAQRASESEMHHTPAGRLAGELLEFQRRLESRQPATDELRPLLETLGCLASAKAVESTPCD
jgi:hypothetical protein